MEARLCELACTCRGLVEWRRGAIELVREVVAADAAFFHELSPRVPLERGAFFGIDAAQMAQGRAHWDENAVLFGRLRDVALEQDGVAIDREALSPSSRVGRAFERRVLRPLRLRTLMLAHLEVRSRIISVLMLGRRGRLFTRADRVALARLVPVLAACDALVQSLEVGVVQGPPRALECVDQRLTERQREIVVQVALGHTNAEIGRALGISENTVRNLLVAIRARLGAANRAEIVRLAVLR